MNPQRDGWLHGHSASPWGAARHSHNGHATVPSHLHGESDVFTSLLKLAGIYSVTVITLEVRMVTVFAGDTGS